MGLQKSYRNINEIKSAFRKWDSDGDGHISRLELRQVMSSFSDSEVDTVFALGDMDKSGGIDYQEFISLLVPGASQTINKFSSQFKTVADIKAAFKRLDANGDGQICRDELRNGMKLSDADLNIVFALGDLDGDGEINYSEFVSVMLPAAANAIAKFRKQNRTLKNARDAYDRLDIDGDGEITYDELVAGLGGDYTANEIDAIFAMGDTDQDGHISFLEFSKIMLPSCQEALNKFWKCFKTVTNVRDAFKKFDADGDGQISRQEVMQGASATGLRISSEEVDTLFILGDKDGNGQIDFSEFAQIMIPTAPEKIAKLKKCFRNRSEVEAAFRRWDVNKDGSISLDELKAGLKGSGILFTDQEAETCFAVGDRNGDNEVSMEEFVELLSSSSSSSCGPIKKFFNYCVEQAFNNIDTNRDGSLSYDELSGSLRVGGFSDQEIHTIFALADHDGDGEISLNELIRSLSKSS